MAADVAVLFCPRKVALAAVFVQIDVWCRLFCLFSLLLPQPIRTHWLTLQAAQARFPGCCPKAESFDCGDGHCLSVSRFHDGHADCADGSDEFCLPGQIPCGQFCADPLHLGECIRNPNCTKTTKSEGQESTNNSPPTPPPPIFCPLLKRRLCGVLNTISCRGYGECIFVKWLMDGKRDCLDGSDEDAEYADLFKITPLRVESTEQREGKSFGPSKFAASTRQSTTGKPQHLATLFPTKSIEMSTTIAPFRFWGWTEKTTTISPKATKILPWKPIGGKGEGKEWFGREGGSAPFGIGPSMAHEFEGGQQGLRVMESTEPGPWESPALDDFGGEFARFLITITQSPFIAISEQTTEGGLKLMTGAAGAGKAVDKSIIFPNWPENGGKGPIQKEEEGRNRIWPTPKLKEGIGGGNLPFTTPKYPFDRGKLDGENLWVPIPFSRPGKVTQGKLTTRIGNMPTMKMSTEGKPKTTVPPEIWQPEGGIGWKGRPKEEEEEGLKGKGGIGGDIGLEGGKGKTEEEGEGGKGAMEGEEEWGKGRRPSAGGEGTKAEGREGESEGRTKEKEGEEGTKAGGEGAIERTTPSNGEHFEQRTTPEGESPPATSTSSTDLGETSTSIVPTSSITSPFSPQIGPAAEMPKWSMPPLSPALLSAISANLSAHHPPLNCTERMSRMASQVYSTPSSTRCQCPKGQMGTNEGQCRPAPIYTFRVRLESLCGLRLREPSPVEEQLALMKIASSLTGQPVCVRAILNGPGIVLNTICESNCTLDELNGQTKSTNGQLAEIRLKIAELTSGPCGHPELNDCNEKAECLMHGMRYECRCLPGTNDTSVDGLGAGRSCEGTVMLQNCIKLFGVCLLVWLLLLLLLCFMLPILVYLCFKYCCETAPASEAVRMRWRWVKAKILRKEPALLPIITTSTAPAASRRESGVGPSGIEYRADMLKVPSIIDGQKPYIPQPFRPQPSQAESEDYLILEDEEGGGGEEKEEEAVKRDSGEKGGEEEESSGAGTIGGKATRQQTEQSTGTLPTQKSEGEIAAVVAPVPTEIRRQESMPAEPAEPIEPQPPPSEQQQRPSSVASRAGTPTIWDQFRILGDQYSRMADIEERRESKNSLDELIDKAKEKEKAQRPPKPQKISIEKGGGGEELAEQMKDELDAELKMKGQREEEEEGRMGGKEESEEEEKQPGRRKWRGGDQEPGRSIPAEMFPAGAVNIGFGGFAPAGNDVDIPSQPMGPTPSMLPPPPQRQFVPKPFGARKTEPTGSRVSSGATVVKMPSGERKMPKGDFVLIRGRTVEKDEQKRRKMEGKRGDEKGMRDRHERMRRLREQKSLDDSFEEEEEKRGEFPSHRTGGAFDPDLPTTSQADPYWQRNLRRQRKEHSADFLRQRFRKEGKALQQIEEQIEEKVHQGCIVGGRKRWDVSPRMDEADLMPPRRELTQSDEAEMNRSLERLETRVHSGCITDRKPWDSSPFREREEPTMGIRRGHSERDLEENRGRRIAGERAASMERRRREELGGKRQNWLDLD